MKARLILFFALCVVQLGVAASSIARRELTLREGTAYRFETAPVDPLDFMRGRYVRLGFSAELVDMPLPSDMRGEYVYALLDQDAAGFARVTALLAERPSTGDYLHLPAHISYQNGGERTQLVFPFRRFYLEESRAPAVEREYRARATGARPAYAVVRVRQGLAVLEQLYVDGVPVAELAAQ